MSEPDGWRVAFGNYYPREVMATFRTEKEAESWASERQSRNNYMLEVEPFWFGENDS